MLHGAGSNHRLALRSVENVVAEGRFDRNWRVPKADMQKMTATGVVTTVTVAANSQN